ncbi:hypothetical protein MPNT_330015 [Candidatus Methylacidithermus pantelleriae]|uniref:Uncharacterized protein n=1 Tax=Candidatus Methylacidithermus pantelleriae TaxID=2744239 RepID=A0A8J2BQT4_9BACT|nr:hypothetical protein MPNT_330015 [Candidatus Methylacidithermus pantelleriae]
MVEPDGPERAVLSDGSPCLLCPLGLAHHKNRVATPLGAQWCWLA